MKHWYEGYSQIDILSLYKPMSAVDKRQNQIARLASFPKVIWD